MKRDQTLLMPSAVRVRKTRDAIGRPAVDIDFRVPVSKTKVAEMTFAFDLDSAAGLALELEKILRSIVVDLAGLN